MLSAGVVQPGQFPPECARGGGARLLAVEPLDDQAGLVRGQDGRDRRCTRLGEPPQASCLGREPG